jgi:cytochrome c553
MQGKGSDKSGNTRNVSRVLVFKLGGKAALPPPSPQPMLLAETPPAVANAARVAAGQALFDRFCSVCHGQAAVGGGVVPDLRTSPFLAVDAWYSIVLEGALRQGGMAAFAPVLDHAQAAAIRDYVIRRANDTDAPRAGKPARQPDASHGAVIVAQGTPAGAPACAQCHAFTGASDASGAFPRLTGQPASYLFRQLLDFRAGGRASAVMAPIARALSTDEDADVSAYFAGAEAPFPPLSTLDPDLVGRGRQLAEKGDPARGLPACSACHGPGGTGEPPTIPYLAGQYAHYTAFTLEMWRRGFRRNSPEAMGLFAGKLREGETAALADYYQQARSLQPVTPQRSR